MTVRLASSDDFGAIAEAGEAFFAESGYADIAEYRKPDLLKTLEAVGASGFVLVAGSERVDGMAAFLLFPLFFDHKATICQELFWWVRPELRGSGIGAEILREAERIAKERDARAISMLCLESVNPEQVSAFYRKNGYAVKEHTFLKEL